MSALSIINHVDDIGTVRECLRAYQAIEQLTTVAGPHEAMPMSHLDRNNLVALLSVVNGSAVAKVDAMTASAKEAYNAMRELRDAAQKQPVEGVLTA